MPALVIDKRPGAGGSIGAGIVAKGAARRLYAAARRRDDAFDQPELCSLSGDRELSFAIIRSTGLPFD